MQPADQYQYLLQQYLQNTATEEERLQLFQALQRNDVDWESALTQLGLQEERDPAYRESDWAVMIDRIVQEPAPRRSIYFINRWWMTAAALVLLVSGIWWMVSRSKNNQPASQPVSTIADVQPGKHGAILTLANGRQLVLDSLGNGVVADQTGVKVMLEDGKLRYNELPNAGSQSPVYNSISTPRGRQFQLILPDGSKVWLNAASSIKYPVAFSSNDRRVEITGEAYFEVTNDKSKPFYVTRGDVQVQVLGTNFNINAYEDEDAIKTTLLEGSVKVVNGQWSMANGNTAILKPGEQAIIAATHSPFTIHHSPDLEQIVAWKNGLFNFQDASLQQVMRQLARWYDVEIVYENGIPDIEFGGKMGRDLTLSNVLHFLEKSGLHCRLTDHRRLVVMP